MWNNIEQIKKIIENSFNKTDVLNKLGLKNHGGNYNTLSSFIRDNKIDVNHFMPNKITKIIENNGSKLISDILIENSTYKSTNNLKRKLYKLGLKERKCELCGQTEEWQGKKMSLILDHINGDRHDNRIENLQIVCPNCNATLETHCRGMRNKGENYDLCNCGDKKQIRSSTCKKCYEEKHRIVTYNRYDICECGDKKTKGSLTCKSCNSKKRKNNINDICECGGKKDIRSLLCKLCNIEKRKNIIRRKVKRPSYIQLLEEIKELGYSATGRKYNVSDNSIRKWKKMYEKYGDNF